MPTISRIMQIVACQLNINTPVSHVYEDYTDISWIELDPNSSIDVTDNTLTITDITKNEEAYIYKDYGANYFNGDFEHQFEINVPGSGVGAPTVGVWGMGNSINDFRGRDDSSDGISIQAKGLNETDYDLSMSLEFQGTSNSVQPLLYNTTYYCTVTRDHDGGVNNTGEYVLTVYSDSSRTNVVSNIVTIDAYAGQQKEFQYLYACGAYNMLLLGHSMSITIGNLRLV